MTNRKIKVFLSGVVNSTNAQNLNCRALMQHLSPGKFEIRALVDYSGDIPYLDLVREKKNADIFYVRYPARIWHSIQLVRGILWSDVAYLCKPECWKLQRFICWLFRKKAFKTVEGALIGTNIDNSIRAFGSLEATREYLGFTGNTYSISRWMNKVNERVCGIKAKDEPLYIGVDSSRFENNIVRDELTDLVMIGNNLFYKGLDEYLELARIFPSLTFHIVGAGLGNVDPRSEVDRMGLRNVVCHGTLNHDELAEMLRRIQLHVFPSKAEGFGKVTFETAAAGIPSIVYGCYGAREWMHGDEQDSLGQWKSLPNADGYVVDDFSQMQSAIRDLLEYPEKLRLMSENARRLAHEWDWANKIKLWEDAIDDVYHNGAFVRMSVK